MQFHLPTDPAKRKQVLALAGAGGLVAVYMVVKHHQAAASGASPASSTAPAAPDPSQLAGNGIDGLAATSGLPAQAAPVTLGAIEAAIAQARSLLHSLGFRIVAGGRPPRHARPPVRGSGGGKHGGGRPHRHPAQVGAGWVGHQPVKPARKSHPIPLGSAGKRVVGGAHSGVARATAPQPPPRPTRIASRPVKW